MKKFICLILIVGITAVVVVPARSNAASSEGSVTGIGSGSFPGGASFAGVNLSRFEIAAGLFTEADGSASGVFYVVLTGRPILGSERTITVEGNVLQGTPASGAANFSGLATLDLGDGLPAVSNVPFNVEMNGNSLVLTIQSTVLPSAAFSEGGLDAL